MHLTYYNYNLKTKGIYEFSSRVYHSPRTAPELLCVILSGKLKLQVNLEGRNPHVSVGKL